MIYKILFAACLVPLMKNVLGQWAVDDDGCTTPFRGSGTCIGIYTCQAIVTFLTNSPRPLPQSNSELLRRYQCGFEQNSIKVCCPGNPQEINRLISNSGSSTDSNNNVGNTEENSSEPDPPDVSNHKNLRLLPQDCGHISLDEKIINGNGTGLYEFPWMALLSYRAKNGPEFRCGGSVINDRYILTAAHCITGVKYPLLGVRVGEHDLRTRQDCETFKNKTTCAPPVQDIAIERLVPHPLYNKSFTFDIGLIRLASRIKYAENVAPVCLPATRETAKHKFSGKKVIVTGFGTTETGRNSPVLLKVSVPYIERKECKKIYQNSVTVSHLMLCAGGRNNQDSCGGDSGGPMKIVTSLYDEPRYVQQGITSFGPRRCGAEGNPGVYTRVGYYMDWILDNISS